MKMMCNTIRIYLWEEILVQVKGKGIEDIQEMTNIFLLPQGCMRLMCFFHGGLFPGILTYLCCPNFLENTCEGGIV